MHDPPVETAIQTTGLIYDGQYAQVPSDDHWVQWKQKRARLLFNFFIPHHVLIGRGHIFDLPTIPYNSKQLSAFFTIDNSFCIFSISSFIEKGF